MKLSFLVFTELAIFHSVKKNSIGKIVRMPMYVMFVVCM